MNNDAVYAQGLLNKALDPRTQPPAIRSFLREEFDVVRRLIPPGSDVVDFGCGMGRHLIDLAAHIAIGVGFDYERSYISTAIGLGAPPHCHFFVGDASAAPISRSFDVAVCLTNTWGTMSDPSGVLREMRRLAPASRSRLLTVYASTSVPARREWYANMGYRVIAATEERIVADGGFTSEHFTEDRLRALLGPCDLYPIADIAIVARC